LKRTAFAVVALIAWLSMPIRAQHSTPSETSSQQPATEKPDDVLAAARRIYNEEGPRPALPVYERALELYRSAGDRRGEANTIGLIGNCHKRLGDLGRAEELLQRALAMKRELRDRSEEGKTLSHLGLLYWEKGEYPKATESFQGAIAIGHELGDRILEGSARNNLGLVYDELGDYGRSLEEYRQALELYRGSDFDRGISDTIGNLGGRHLLLGQYAQALRYYQEALALDEKTKSKSSMSFDLTNIALSHLGLGHAEEALRHFDKAITLAREGGFKREEADALKGKGSALARIGKYDTALQHYRQALASYEVAGLKQQLTEALGELGALHLQLGDHSSAEKDFRRAMEISTEIKHSRGVTLNLIALGNIELRRRRPEEASALYLEALARAKEAGDWGSESSARIQLAFAYRDLDKLEDAAREADTAVEIAREAQARPLEARAEYARGELKRKQGHADYALGHFAAGERILQSAPDPELGWRIAFGRGQALQAEQKDEEALTALKRAVEIIEDLRNQLQEERYRSGYLEDKYQVYVTLVQLLLKLGRLEEAFTYSEKLRARSFLDLLSRGRLPIRNETQQQAEIALREKIRGLRREIGEETAKSAPQKKRQALEYLSAELVLAEHAYQNLLDDLMRTEPGYAGARAASIPASSEVQKQLPEDVALVEYVVGENEIAVFLLRSNQLRARTVSHRANDLQAKIELLRGLIARESGEDWRVPAVSLYRVLVEPLVDAGWLRGVKRLYLVPHGFLHYVPFAALPSSKEPNSRPLIDAYEVSYLPAAAALVYGSGYGNSRQSVLALAPGRSRLQFTQEEARSVAASFAGSKELLLGPRATESSFKRLAGRYDVLHLATHGFFNKNNPLLSGVELEPDSAEDGRLEVHEILGLRLNAHLVTLSACETALGGGYFAEVPAGDDLVGLTRAFLYAGSPSVLASLWEVSDRSTLHLMRGFYERLGPSDKAGALAQAQRAMLRRGGREAHPYYWGAFILVGQMN